MAAKPQQKYSHITATFICFWTTIDCSDTWCDQDGSKQTWDKVREIRGKQASNRKSLSVNISDLNRHYASISMDPNYTSPNIKVSVYQHIKLVQTLHLFYNFLSKHWVSLEPAHLAAIW